MKIKKGLVYLLIFFGSLFFVNIYCTELKFINLMEKPLYVKLEGWKRMAGLAYKQEEPMLVGSLKALKWSPVIKKEVTQTVLFVYDAQKQLLNKIDLKSCGNKKVGVAAGYARTIIYSGKDLYEDIIEFSGKKVSYVVKIATDIAEKSRELFLDSISLLFSLQRKAIREKRDPLNPEPFDIIQSNPYAKTDAKVRVGGSVACYKEKAIFEKRQIVVKDAQEKFMGIKFQAGQKPLVVAFVASGGGQRARLCALGSSIGASKIGLFDCSTYFSALSGSTWFLAPWLISGLSLQEYERRAISEAKNDLGFKDMIVDLKYSLDQIKVKFAFGQSIGIFDIYGSLLAVNYLKGLGIDGNGQRCYLSWLAEKQEMKDGFLPIPLFAAVTAEFAMGHTWCTFTPWEFGSKEFGFTGAHIPIWAFGRKFESLNSTKNWGTKENIFYEPEATLGYLMGIWGSAIAANFGQLYQQVIKDMNFGPVKTIFELLMKKSDLKHARIVWPEVNNFMYNWSSSVFSKYKYLKLADAGVKYINPIFTTYRRPSFSEKIKDGAAPDLIIIWDSGAGKAIDELKMQSEYAKKHGYPFPEIDFNVVGKEVLSVFTKNPDKKKYKDWDVPTVIYMKMMIDKNLIAKYIQDPKIVDTVKKAGDPTLAIMAKRLEKFDLQGCMKNICETFNFKYNVEKDGQLISQMLVDMSKFNTIVSQEKIKKAMLDRVELNKKRDGIVLGIKNNAAKK